MTQLATSEARPDDSIDRSLDHLDNGAGSLTVTHQPPVSADIHIRADCSPADLWYRIATNNAFQETLAEAVRDVLAITAPHERIQTLLNAGVTGAHLLNR